MSATDIAAWWGAVIATLALVWNIFTWIRSGPRFVAKVEWIDYLKPASVRFTITNRGQQPATIKEVHLTDLPKFIPSKSLNQDCRLFHPGSREEYHGIFPRLLAPGVVDQQTFEIDPGSEELRDNPIAELFASGKLFYLIKVSNSDVPLHGRVAPEDPLD